MREGTSSPHALLGRRDECRIVDEMLAAVRGGRSVAVVVRGEPGIGKTALLQYAERSASDFTIARAAATEVEMELAFGGLHQLCTPFLKHLGLLPVPQRHALETAFGLSAGTPPDRFLVGLAVLTLLTGAAEEHPLLCLVDDAQWLDRVSAQTLAFVARRLVADRIGLFFAMREPVEKHELAGLRQLEVVGLSHDYARALLSSATPGRLDERIRERILAEARGNPLALLVLPQGLTPAELAGGFGLPSGRTVAQHIETEFARRLETLPADTRRLLLVAAADAIGDVPLLWRAAQRLGIGPEAAADAESAGFIEFGARARFLHPMLRAAVYRAAPAEERRAAHGALAEATDERIDPEGRAWHRAHACLGPDEQVACELERSAELVRSRGGIAAAAAFLQRAAELTLDPDRRTARALAAAEASFRAGSLEAAYDLLASAELGAIDQLRRARLDRLRGQILFASGHAREASALMLNAATSMQVLDDRDLRETYVEAFNVAIIVGRLAQQGGIQAVADAARRARPATPPPTAMDLLLDGLTTRFTQGYTAALPELRRALTAFRTDAEQNRDCLLR